MTVVLVLTWGLIIYSLVFTVGFHIAWLLDQLKK